MKIISAGLRSPEILRGKITQISVGGSDVTQLAENFTEPESYFYLKSRPKPKP
jgi:hypothetical protein